MEVEEFESYLTMDELANFKKSLAERRLGGPKNYHEHVEESDSDNVVTSAFVWTDTAQSLEYWRNIEERFKKGEPLTSGYLKGHQYMQYFTANQWSDLCAIAMEFLGTEVYSKWMEGTYVNMTNFLGCGIPTSKQSQFITNIRVADSTIFRLTRGYQVKAGEFLTKEDTRSSAYTSTTHTRVAL